MRERATSTCTTWRRSANCTLSEKGLILEANLTAATLLGVARGALIKQPLTRFTLPEDQDIYYHRRKQLFETGAPQAYKLRMVKKDGAQFWAHLEATAANDEGDALVCRVVLSDNPERKRGEERLQKSNQDLKTAIEQSNESAEQARKANAANLQD